MTRYVAFLCAINVVNRRVTMDRLRSIFVALGFADVQTFIGSGNVIFDSEAEPDAPAIESGLLAELGFEVPVMLRSADELLAVRDRNPFAEIDLDPEGQIEVSFLGAEPGPGPAQELISGATPPDRLAVVGLEVYWFHIGPRSDSDHSEAKVMRVLDTLATQRSMRTVERIATKFLEP